ncbi:hypothetical protein V1477_008049 [Vespula maculifrons]|uniref:Uncharacterized protein n=1 Tax=Vespula maculifrons TaxID=7453 RepID=A0ABD2CFJ6_VESMC
MGIPIKFCLTSHVNITKLLAKSNFRTIRRSKRELPKFSKQWKDNDTLFKQTSTNPSKMLLLIPCHTLTSLIRDKNFGPNVNLTIVP